MTADDSDSSALEYVGDVETTDDLCKFWGMTADASDSSALEYVGDVD
jgi:hypothetical protein